MRSGRARFALPVLVVVGLALALVLRIDDAPRKSAAATVAATGTARPLAASVIATPGLRPAQAAAGADRTAGIISGVGRATRSA